MKRTGERGAVTAEYSIGTLGAAFIAYWLWRIGTISGDHNIFARMLKLAWSNTFDGDNWAWRWLS